MWDGLAAEKAEEGKPDGLHRNASIQVLFAYPKAAAHIPQFLNATEVGRRRDERKREEDEATRREWWGWREMEAVDEEAESGSERSGNGEEPRGTGGGRGGEA